MEILNQKNFGQHSNVHVVVAPKLYLYTRNGVFNFNVGASKRFALADVDSVSFLFHEEKFYFFKVKSADAYRLFKRNQKRKGHQFGNRKLLNYFIEKLKLPEKKAHRFTIAEKPVKIDRKKIYYELTYINTES